MNNDNGYPKTPGMAKALKRLNAGYDSEKRRIEAKTKTVKKEEEA